MLTPFAYLAVQINTKLCDKFSVGHYPMLFWGPPSKFVAGSWEPNQEKSEILLIDDGRTADRLLNWINKKMGRYKVLCSSCIETKPYLVLHGYFSKQGYSF